jgi:Serine dehydratase alpha chain
MKSELHDDDVSFVPERELNPADVPAGVDRRTFMMRSAHERCVFGAVKSWTGFMIASNEIPANRRVDFDTTVAAMALTAKEMNSKYKETSEGGLAVSVTLC